MSRLYTVTTTDTREQPVTAAGHQEIHTFHRWGSVDDSKMVASVTTDWYKDQPKPKVVIEIGDGVAYEIYGPGGRSIALSR